MDPRVGRGQQRDRHRCPEPERVACGSQRREAEDRDQRGRHQDRRRPREPGAVRAAPGRCLQCAGQVLQLLHRLRGRGRRRSVRTSLLVYPPALGGGRQSFRRPPHLRDGRRLSGRHRGESRQAPLKLGCALSPQRRRLPAATPASQGDSRRLSQVIVGGEIGGWRRISRLKLGDALQLVPLVVRAMPRPSRLGAAPLMHPLSGLLFEALRLRGQAQVRLMRAPRVLQPRLRPLLGDDRLAQRLDAVPGHRAHVQLLILRDTLDRPGRGEVGTRCRGPLQLVGQEARRVAHP